MNRHLGQIFVANLMSGGFGRILGALTPLIIIPMMIRVWGSETFGEWLIITAIPAYVMLSPDFGLTGAVVNQLGMFSVKEGHTEAKSLYSKSSSVLAIASTVFTIIGFFIASNLNWRVVGVRSMGNSTITMIVLVMCIQVALAQQVFLKSGIYRFARNNPRFGFLTTITQTIALTSNAISLLVGLSPLGYCAVGLCASASNLALISYDSKRVLPGFSEKTQRTSLEALRPYILPGLGQVAMPMIQAFQNQGVLIVVGIVLGASSVATYQAARVFTNGVKSLIGLVTASIAVEIPALLSDGKKAIVQTIVVIISQFGFAVTLLSIFFVYFLGPKIHSLWLGDDFRFPNYIIFILMVTLFPFSIGQAFTTVLLAANKIHLNVAPLAALSLFSVALIAALATELGLYGVCIGILCLETGLMCVSAKLGCEIVGFTITGFAARCGNIQPTLQLTRNYYRSRT